MDVINEMVNLKHNAHLYKHPQVPKDFTDKAWLKSQKS